MVFWSQYKTNQLARVLVYFLEKGTNSYSNRSPSDAEIDEKAVFFRICHTTYNFKPLSNVKGRQKYCV